MLSRTDVSTMMNGPAIDTPSNTDLGRGRQPHTGSKQTDLGRGRQPHTGSTAKMTKCLRMLTDQQADWSSG